MLKTEQTTQAISRAVRASYIKEDANYCFGMIQALLDMSMEDISKAHAMLERGDVDRAKGVLETRFKLVRDVASDYAERNG